MSTSRHAVGKTRDLGRVLRAVVVCAGVALVVGPVGVSARPAPPDAGAAHASRAGAFAAGASYSDDTVLVGFRKGTNGAAIASTVSAVGAKQSRIVGPGVHVLHVPAGKVLATIASLRARRDVGFAEPDYLQTESGVPNDPSFGLQWAEQNTGQSVNGVTGTAGADEHAVPAWNVTTGSKSIVVAEVDSGVDYTHPDLAGNIWSNPGGIGNCAAGTHGYNVLTATCDPMDDETTYGGHGTHVAGIIGATGNNGVGVAGVNWQTTILPVKWLDSSGSGTTSNLIAALDWVVKAKQAGVNVRVVNDSATFVGTAYSQALADELATLAQNDILFVTAAGNTGDNNDDPTVGRYPCRYGAANEICVTASDQNDTLPSWANYGPQTVDLAAPGANIYSTLRVAAGSYGYISGGSMAAGEVSGAAALVLSQRPTLSTADLKTDLLTTVDQLPALSGLVRTGGRLDVCAALQGCTAAPVNTVLPAISGTAQEGQTLTASQGSWSGSPTSYAYQWLRCDAAGAGCVAIAGATSSSYPVVENDVGSTLRAQVTATNASGSAGAVSAQSAAVPPAGSYFGNPSVGSGSDPSTADWKRVVTFSLAQAGSVSKLSLYLTRNTAGSQVLRGVIYADLNGTPGALLATSNEVTFSSSAAGGWYDLPFASPVSLQAGTYWIGAIFGATSNVTALRYNSVASSSAVAADTYSDGPSNPFGTPNRIDSEQLSVYATYTPSSSGGSAPVNSVLPAISGTAQEGQTLTASQGSWSGSPTSYAYQWQRCDSAGANCGNLAGATGQSYQLASADVGSTIRVVVTAANSTGSTAATSNPTAIVTAAASTGTLGTSTVGPSSDNILADRKRVNHYNLPVAAGLSKLSIYLQPGSKSGQQLFEGIVYADQNGAPGALLGVTNPFTYSSTNGAGWYDLPFASPLALQPGTYWIGIISGTNSYAAAFRWTSVAGSRAYNTNKYTSGPSNPFGNASIDSEQMSIYATYTTSP